jgi:nicotinamidase-related amidase
MSKLLLVIDVQNDFINNNTLKVLDNIKNLIDSKMYDIVAFTRFINDEDSIWYKKLNYKGCITEEQQEIVIDTKNYKVFDKRIYTALNEELKQFIAENNIKEIYLCGFDTDACVQKTALDMFEQNYDVYILKDYCMSHTGEETHNAYINNMKRLIGRDRVI